MKKLTTFLLLIIIFSSVLGENYQINSPDKKISVSISIEDQITYQVVFNQKKVIDTSLISFVLDQATPIGKKWEY